MLPFFNITGPCVAGEHYMLPPERRLGLGLARERAGRYELANPKRVHVVGC